MKYQSQRNALNVWSSAFRRSGANVSPEPRKRGTPNERGVALVITLIMLSVITFLTVAFLAVSRRDRASVTQALNQTDSHLMADTALERFRVELISGMISRNDLKNYDLMLTRNFINPAGFDPALGLNLTNVNYDYRVGGTPLINTDPIFNIANLFYDPRPPVFVQTNSNKALPLDFRFWLDYNRNGRFETNGLVDVFTDEIGTTTNKATLLGEPEWIGVLQNPERPHSPTNKFVGRYLYFALPIGKTLDWNYIHDYAKGNIGLSANMPVNADGFLRNQGSGSWELNLAGFLVDLNTNMYVQNAVSPYNYLPDVSSGTSPNSGDAFNDALSFLRYRYNGNFNLLSRVANLFPGNGSTAFSGVTPFQTDLIDGYTTRPVLVAPFVNVIDPDFKPADLTGKPWSGSDNVSRFLEPQELFDTSKSSANFVAQLQRVSTNNNTYDRYTFSRLLEQIGMGSEPEVSGKININYVNDPTLNTVNTNFVEWTPIQFFTNVAARLFKDNLITNGPGGNWYMFNTTNPANLVHSNFSYTSIQIYPTNEYTAQVHRLLQVAANIYDATTTNRFPTVFRPQFQGSAGQTFITNFVAETNSLIIRSNFLSGIQDRTNVTNPDGLVWGVPLIVGTKKGFPNFNKFVMQTTIQVSRNLLITKKDTNATVVLTGTNQILSLGVSNTFALEAWNSYTNSYSNFQFFVTNVMSMALATNGGGIIWPANGSPTNYSSGTNSIPFALWPSTLAGANAFLLPIGTNSMTLITNAQFTGGTPPFIGNTNLYQSGVGFPVPAWNVVMTNRMVYFLVDTSQPGGRVIDYVSMSDLTNTIDILTELLDSSLTPKGLGGSTLARMWNTNRAGATPTVFTPTRGVENQIHASMDDSPKLSTEEWQSYSPTSPTGTQRERAIDYFRNWMGFGKSGEKMPGTTQTQTPFNPTQTFDHTAVWGINDPLVHYMSQDLRNSTNISILRAVNTPVPSLFLKERPETYRPWGGNRLPGKSGQEKVGDPDPQAYELRIKDPGVRWSDDWDFPTNKFPSIGWLGRVHRGTPWQTIYLKSASMTNGNTWFKWAGHNESHPTNDWKLMDVFTTSPNDNASRGLLSVNQTNKAAWSALLSGVIVLSNSIPNPNSGSTPQFQSFVMQPNSTELARIVDDINGTRQTNYGGTFQSLGQILATPSLSYGIIDQVAANGKTNQIPTASPYLNISTENQRLYGLTDEAVERIPRQIMSLLKLGEPRFVVYCYGQSLKPANNSLVLSAPAGSGLFNLCTNYQITGEVLTRTVLHVEGTVKNPKTVIDSYNVLPE